MANLMYMVQVESLANTRKLLLMVHALLLVEKARLGKRIFHINLAGQLTQHIM